jgi:transcriptional regulator with XRE-family HTH domain
MKDNFISQSAIRFKEERKKLGLNQAQTAGLCFVSREMWGKYERGEAVPGGDVLFFFAAMGADVQYILTGIRIPASEPTDLSPREIALLDNYRHIEDENDKKLIERTALLVAKAEIYEATEKKAVNHR